MLLTIGSILLYLFAMGWSLMLLRRTLTWRFGAFTALLGLMTFQQVMRLLNELGFCDTLLADRTNDFFSLAMSLVAFTTVIFLEVVVSEQKRLEEHLQFHAYHDPLTGLPNRALLLKRLSQTLARRRRRSDDAFALLFLDLDGFKTVNDSLGHAAGDDLLVQVSHRLENCLRSTDTVARLGCEHTLARLGGDEFTIILEGVHDVNDAVRIANRIQQVLTAPFTVAGQELTIGASIGITSSTSPYTDCDQMLRDADLAMYRAKAQGKRQVAVFDTTMHADAMRRLELEKELRHAVDRMDFQLEYQPVVDLATGAIAGFEAFVRWQHPQRGMLAPSAFIALAEELGLIVAIERWVLRQACTDLRTFQAALGDARSLSLSVNLSVLELLEPDLADEIKTILSETGVAAECLKLDISERMLLLNPETLLATLQRLRALHVDVHLDDFGTGYSPLTQLNRFRVDRLKIDPVCIKALLQNDQGQPIVEAMIQLAHCLKMKVVAEGIETGEQLTELRRLGCDFGQGNFFAAPGSREAAIQLLSGQPHW